MSIELKDCQRKQELYYFFKIHRNVDGKDFSKVVFHEILCIIHHHSSRKRLTPQSKGVNA